MEINKNLINMGRVISMYIMVFNMKENMKEYMKEYNKTPKYKAYQKAYQQTPARKAQNRKNSANWRAREKTETQGVGTLKGFI